MFKKVNNPNVPEQDHHEFIYSDGRKIPKHDTGLRYAYIDKYGLFHVSRWEDDASKYGGGIYGVTDELTARNGLPAICGKAVKIYGAGTDRKGCYVLLGGKSDGCKEYVGGNKVTVSRKHPERHIELDRIRQMYEALK
ncbi:hypothetical protein IMSAG049_00778 [Clostridiales bacterium]|nr:hypothetical protein IMSAG049_00778 [Clostridiales bacterium]